MFLEVQHHGCPLQLCVDMTLVELERDRAGSLFPLASSNHSHGNRDLLCARCHAKYFITLLSLSWEGSMAVQRQSLPQLTLLEGSGLLIQCRWFDSNQQDEKS